ncbi:hypothetical protein CRYUN_Cryun25bG0118300 [Craigia yunnanensis]
MCGKKITITASNGRNTTAIVVDECDSRCGCDKEHAYQPPCKNNIVDGSDAVWKALRSNKNVGDCGCHLVHGLSFHVRKGMEPGGSVSVRACYGSRRSPLN